MLGQEIFRVQTSLDMTLWQAEADSTSNSKLYLILRDSGLPHEAIVRLHELVKYTKKIAGQVVAVGKIILIKIIEFVKANPCLVMGAGISVVIGAVVADLITSMPFLKKLLTPVAMALGITVPLVNVVVGNRPGKRLLCAGEDIVKTAHKFFQSLADAFNACFS